MFQFRRFPAYAYFIQRTLTGYCPAGLPHSEISGSSRMCRSPKLIAACHVLLRLLMPRHSPCALFCLTFSNQSPDQRFSLLELCRLSSRVFFLKLYLTLNFLKVPQLLEFFVCIPAHDLFCCLACLVCYCSVFKVHS